MSTVYDSLASRLVAFPGLLLSSAVSVILTCAAATNWTTAGILYRVTIQSRASVQIVVHLLSWVFSAAQIYTIHSLLKARVNLRLLHASLSLNDLQFWLSITGTGIDLTLHWSLLLTSLACLAVLSIPSLLWAGATTPVVTTAVGSDFDISLAHYNSASLKEWSDASGWADGRGSVVEVHNNYGLFGYQPLYVDQGLFMTQASSASSRTSSVQTHAKIDNTGYTYIGRSYGIGASVGLEAIEDMGTTVLNYTYREQGYLTSVNCITNFSADVILTQFSSEVKTSQYIPNIFQASGRLPNDPHSTFYSDLVAISDVGNSSVFAIIACDNNGRYIWQIVSGTRYSMFNYMQCEATFSPTQFQVVVDVLDKTILVKPSQLNISAFDIDKTGVIKHEAFQQPWAIATLVNAITSVMGNAFFSNVQNVAASYGQQDSTLNASLTSGNTTDAIRHRGTAEALESIIDNSLLTFAMTQIMVANDTVVAKVTPTVNAVRIGQDIYIYTLLVVTLLTLIVFLVELFLTRCWKNLPSFNVASIKSSIIGASKGGHSIAEAVTKRPETGECCSIVGNVDIRMQRQGSEFALIASSRERFHELNEELSQIPRRHVKPMDKIFTCIATSSRDYEDEIPLQSDVFRPRMAAI